MYVFTFVISFLFCNLSFAFCKIVTYIFFIIMTNIFRYKRLKWLIKGSKLSLIHVDFLRN